MGAPLKKDSGIDWKWLIPTALTAVVVVGGALWGLHSEFSRMGDRLSELDKHVTRVETAVRIVSAKQGGDTKTLTDEALAVAVNASSAGRTEDAKAVIKIANRLLEEQRAANARPSQQFFEQAFARYLALKRSAPLKTAAHEGATKLAEYRTQANEHPEGIIAAAEMHISGPFVYVRNGLLNGNAVANSPEGMDIDGWVLDNVIIKNATVVYRGGPLLLRNVKFVNCRFKVADSSRGDQLLLAALRQPATTTIG